MCVCVCVCQCILAAEWFKAQLRLSVHLFVCKQDTLCFPSLALVVSSSAFLSHPHFLSLDTVVTVALSLFLS